MKKSPFLLLGLLLIASILLSACTLPARTRGVQITPGFMPLATNTPAAQSPAPNTEPGVGQATQPAAPPQATSTQEAPTTAPVVPTATEPPTQPPPEVATATGAPPAATATAPATIPTPVLPANASRIQFQAGATSSEVRGELDGGASVLYVLGATAGQNMRVEVWSPNGDVYLGLVGPNGQTLLDLNTRTTRWSGALPANGDYLMTLSAGGGRTSYAATVSIDAQASGPTSTPSASQFDPYTTYGTPDMEDQMNGTNRAAWVTEEGTWPNTTNIRLYVENSRTYVTGKRQGFSTWWFSWPELEDFYIELTAETGTCTAKDAYGLILRGPEHRAGESYGYVVSFSCDGSYQVFRLDSADPYSAVTLVNWTRSDALRTGSNQRNVLGIKAEGSTLVIYANGQRLTEVTDAEYDEGRYGLFVSPDSTPGFTYRAVKLAYWELPTR